MKEIKKLGNKYLVLKWSDVRNLLSMEDRQDLNRLVQFVHVTRTEAGKVGSPSYVVLNLDDGIDLEYLEDAIGRCLPPYKFPESELKPHRVKEIAVALVNAILKAKGE